jgi:hypothetical protein
MSFMRCAREVESGHCPAEMKQRRIIQNRISIWLALFVGVSGLMLAAILGL